MSPEEKLSQLLRFKRHEQPREGYFEDFLTEFHQRQRQEMLQRGSLSLLWERVCTWAEGLRRPAVVWSAAAAYAAVVLLVCLWPTQGRTPSSMIVVTPPNPTAAPTPNPAVNPNRVVITPPPSRNAVPVSTEGNQQLPTTGQKQKNVDEPLPPPTEPQPTEKLRDL
jgi:hypothetical protein